VQWVRSVSSTFALLVAVCHETNFDAWLLRVSKTTLPILLLQVGASDAGQHVLAAVPCGTRQRQRRRAGERDISDHARQRSPEADCMMH